MAELKISAQELTEFKGFYYDHRLTLTVEGVNEENFEQVRGKLKDICGDNIYCGTEKPALQGQALGRCAVPSGIHSHAGRPEASGQLPGRTVPCQACAYGQFHS